MRVKIIMFVSILAPPINGPIHGTWWWVMARKNKKKTTKSCQCLHFQFKNIPTTLPYSKEFVGDGIATRCHVEFRILPSLIGVARLMWLAPFLVLCSKQTFSNISKLFTPLYLISTSAVPTHSLNAVVVEFEILPMAMQLFRYKWRGTRAQSVTELQTYLKNGSKCSSSPT